MHSILNAVNVFILKTKATGIPFLIFGLLFAAIQWIVVAGVMASDKKASKLDLLSQLVLRINFYIFVARK